MGWFRRQLWAWGRLPAQQARVWLIGLGVGALLLTVFAAALGVSSELDVVQIEIGIGLALAALAVAFLLVVPLMAGILMRRWPLESEPADGPDPHASNLPLPEKLSETLFDLALDSSDQKMESISAKNLADGLLGAEASGPAGLWLVAQRSARNSQALGVQIGEHLSGVVQARQRMAASLAVIDRIACETNALALRALIESDVADHADHARLFSELTEVRTLAQRAASAAREIHEVVLATQAKMDPVVLDVVASIHTEALVADTQTMLACLEELSKPLSSNLAASPPHVANDHPLARMHSVIERQNRWAHHSACLVETLDAQAERLHKVVEAFRVLQQTQEAAWMAQCAIHQARGTARDTARDRAVEGRKASRPAL